MKTVSMGLLVSSVLILARGGALIAQGPGTTPSPRDDPEQQCKALSRSMAKKLKHTQELVAALAVEDFV